MPYKKKTYKKTNKKKGLATVPKMMSRTLAYKRKMGIDSRVFWFKSNGQVSYPQLPDTYKFNVFSSQDIQSEHPHGWLDLLHIYDEYKVLGVTIKLFPANVDFDLKRGNHGLFLDQRIEPGFIQPPVTIHEVINNASFRMITSRRTVRTSLWRARGNPEWGSCRDPGNNPDSWKAAAYLIVQDCSGIDPPSPGGGARIAMYYYTVQTKVVFRGRRNDDI